METEKRIGKLNREIKSPTFVNSSLSPLRSSRLEYLDIMAQESEDTSPLSTPTKSHSKKAIKALEITKTLNSDRKVFNLGTNSFSTPQNGSLHSVRKRLFAAIPSTSNTSSQKKLDENPFKDELDTPYVESKNVFDGPFNEESAVRNVNIMKTPEKVVESKKRSAAKLEDTSPSKAEAIVPDLSKKARSNVSVLIRHRVLPPKSRN